MYASVLLRLWPQSRIGLHPMLNGHRYTVEYSFASVFPSFIPRRIRSKKSEEKEKPSGDGEAKMTRGACRLSRN
jgi:hypothetical protein